MYIFDEIKKQKGIKMGEIGFVACLVSSCLFLASFASACDRCVHRSKVAFFPTDQPLQSGACGYGSLATTFNKGHLAAAVSSIYGGGLGCGACFQMRCKYGGICSEEGTKVMVTDENRDNRTDFVVSKGALMAMAANTGFGHRLLRRGLVDVEYKRIPCDYEKQNLSIRVEESSLKPNYLAIKFLHQAGQTEIVAVDVAQVGSSNWGFLTRLYGAVWNGSRVPSGALQIRFVVTAGYDGKWYWSKQALPADWKNGATYDMGLQITDIAQEACFPCDNTTWTLSPHL